MTNLEAPARGIQRLASLALIKRGAKAMVRRRSSATVLEITAGGLCAAPIPFPSGLPRLGRGGRALQTPRQLNQPVASRGG
jgi:hypothetical protein